MSLTPTQKDSEYQEDVAFQEHDLKGYRIEDKDYPWVVVALCVVGLCLVLVATQAWGIERGGNRLFVPLYFMPDTANTAVDILTSLLVITALMERAVEVFIGSTRSIKRQLTARYIETLDSLMLERQQSIEKAKDADNLPSLQQSLTDLKARRHHVAQRLTSYRTGTRIRALSFSLVFGTIIALAGLRVISPLLDVPYASLSYVQWAALQIVDVAGTAGLIAGGTSGIHRLIRNIGARTEPEGVAPLEAATRPG